jgi:hypothetical protein
VSTVSRASFMSASSQFPNDRETTLRDPPASMLRA